jgi:2-polyprenyl-6-methoxyphenol hydroxylase-like FAD-dependent oxidoreductase
MNTDVIIVGAGPTGLALACQFIRYGIDFIILDSKETTTPHSKAIGVQARTLELYDQIGFADKLIAQGAIAKRARIVVGGKVRGEAGFGELGKGLSPYPFVLIVEQGKHEKILHDHIISNGQQVLWQTELVGFTQNESGVRASVRSVDNQINEVEAKYLIGCDGASSSVRHSLGLKFEGSTFERLFYVADVEINWDFTHDSLYACLAANTSTAFFPMAGGETNYRIVGTFPEDDPREVNDILYEEVESQIVKDTGINLDITRVNWFSVYKVHSRHVNRFSQGRCFLAGDSAHIHTPAGAQGMNTGIQDGYNLAWKLWLVLLGKSNAQLLETYNEERLENAKNLLETTDRFFNIFASRDWLISFLRTRVAPYVAGTAFRSDVVKKFIFPRVSQIGINYRHSSLSRNGDDNLAVKTGDRMPYFLVDGASVYDKLHEPKFHLLSFVENQQANLSAGERLAREYDDVMDFNVISLDEQVVEIFGTNRPFTLLLRPDNYIGLISTHSTLSDLKDYLDHLAGVRD